PRGPRLGAAHLAGPRERGFPPPFREYETPSALVDPGLEGAANQLPAGGLRVSGRTPDDRSEGLLPERRVLGAAGPDRGGQIECHRLVADVLWGVGVLEARGCGSLRDPGPGVQTRVLVAQLVLLREELGILGPQPVDLVRGLGRMRSQHQVCDD